MEDYISKFLHSLKENTNLDTSKRVINQDLTLLDNYCSDNTKSSQHLKNAMIDAREYLIQKYHFYICRTKNAENVVPSSAMNQEVKDQYITLTLEPNFDSGQMALLGGPVKPNDFQLFLKNILANY